MFPASRIFRIGIILSTLLLATIQASLAHGQADTEESLTLSLRRNFGYSLGGQMQGTYTIRVEGPDDLQSVTFLLDGEVIGEDLVAPFSLAFNTRDYSEGIHRFGAVAHTEDGAQLQAATLSRQFVATSAVTIAVLAVVVLAIAFRVGSYVIARRAGSRGATFGYLGGAVCPNCGRAFGIHWWSLRLGLGRLDRCPNCGKWNMVRRASAEALVAAEDRQGEKYRGQDNPGSSSDGEALRRRIEESRYDQG